MGIFQEIFQIGIEKKEIFPPINGNEKSCYSFSYTRKQWLREKIIEHEVVGNIDMGISQYDQNFFKRSIHFRNIECRKKTNFIPEYYLLWDYVQRADFFINKNGEIVSYDFKSFGNNEIYKGKIKKIEQYIEDTQRKKTILDSLKKINNNPEILKAVLKINPVMQLFTKEFIFRNKSIKEESSKTGNIYDTQDILENYFGEGIHLPIKKKSALDKRKEEMVIGCCVGGIDKDKMKEEELFRYIKKIAGKANIGRKLLLDYSEYYQYDKNEFLNTHSFTKAENYSQTAIADTWYLEEQTMVNKLIK